MKFAIIFGFAAVLLGSLLLWQDQKKDTYCIEEWLANTQDLLKNAGELFSREQPIQQENQGLDEELQALLPVESPKQIDWSYKEEVSSELTISAQDQELLPNLFDTSQSKGAKLSGQLHMDESDNIVGAEVNVAIPTN